MNNSPSNTIKNKQIDKQRSKLNSKSSSYNFNVLINQNDILNRNSNNNNNNNDNNNNNNNDNNNVNYFSVNNLQEISYNKNMQLLNIKSNVNKNMLKNYYTKICINDNILDNDLEDKNIMSAKIRNKLSNDNLFSIKLSNFNCSPDIKPINIFNYSNLLSNNCVINSSNKDNTILNSEILNNQIKPVINTNNNKKNINTYNKDFNKDNKSLCYNSPKAATTKKCLNKMNCNLNIIDLDLNSTNNKNGTEISNKRSINKYYSNNTKVNNKFRNKNKDNSSKVFAKNDSTSVFKKNNLVNSNKATKLNLPLLSNTNCCSNKKIIKMNIDEELLKVDTSYSSSKFSNSKSPSNSHNFNAKQQTNNKIKENNNSLKSNIKKLYTPQQNLLNTNLENISSINKLFNPVNTTIVSNINSIKENKLNKVDKRSSEPICKKNKLSYLKEKNEIIENKLYNVYDHKNKILIGINTNNKYININTFNNDLENKENNKHNKKTVHDKLNRMIFNASNKANIPSSKIKLKPMYLTKHIKLNNNNCNLDKKHNELNSNYNKLSSKCLDIETNKYSNNSLNKTLSIKENNIDFINNTDNNTCLKENTRTEDFYNYITKHTECNNQETNAIYPLNFINFKYSKYVKSKNNILHNKSNSLNTQFKSNYLNLNNIVFKSKSENKYNTLHKLVCNNKETLEIKTNFININNSEVNNKCMSIKKNNKYLNLNSKNDNNLLISSLFINNSSKNNVSKVKVIKNNYLNSKEDLKKNKSLTFFKSCSLEKSHNNLKNKNNYIDKNNSDKITFKKNLINYKNFKSNISILKNNNSLSKSKYVNKKSCSFVLNNNFSTVKNIKNFKNNNNNNKYKNNINNNNNSFYDTNETIYINSNDKKLDSLKSKILINRNTSKYNNYINYNCSKIYDSNSVKSNKISNIFNNSNLIKSISNTSSSNFKSNKNSYSSSTFSNDINNNFIQNSLSKIMNNIPIKEESERINNKNNKDNNILNSIDNYSMTKEDNLYKTNSSIFKTIKETHGIEDPFIQKEYGIIIRWKALEIISEGRISTIYKAIDLNKGNFLVVKKYNCYFIDKEFEAYNNEINVYKNLSHPNIVSYFGSEIIDKQFFIYLEYVPGGSLKNLIYKLGNLNEKLLKIYIYQIVKGISYLHSKRIVHRDIKCANILISQDGVVKLSDFGVSSCLSISSDSLSESNLLKSLKGTVPWMAPEVINQNYYGKKADIWSLGCTIIEMISGDNPWNNLKEDNYIQALLRIGSGNDIPLFPNNINVDLANLLKLCLERDVSKRIKINEVAKSIYFNS